VTRKTADRKGATARLRSVGATCLLGALVSFPAHAFEIEEATIQDVHRAIQAGETTCTQIVTAYIERAKAYNGICTALVTQDGKPVAAAKGPMRTGAQLRFPTKTVPVTGVLPDFDQYKGLPIEYGRMETTISDPTVKQQYGMRVGIANAGQLNALETVNIRGERSVSCKARCDLHPSKGPLPASCPKACDEFRKQPDALERAAELDKQYGTKPDLNKLPMYCVAFSWKNWYDAKDMRATGGNDINYAMDAPKYDSPDVANLRAKGAISFAVATASSTGMSSNGPNKATTVIPSNSFQDAAWGGQACNPYDTERVPRGTSNGSGVSVSANLAQCSICEQTSASCKGPASRNNVVNLLPTKGITQDGGPGYSYSGDRAGIHCRTVADAALVLDAIKGFDTEDMFTAIPKGLIPKEPYASVVVGSSDVTAKPMTGMRIGVVREFMVKHTKNDAAISDQIDNEIKTALRDKLGAELIESVDPMYADDSSIPNMKYTFQDAFREVLPHNAPEFFFQKDSRGALEFAVPGWDVTSADYQLALALGKAPLSEKLTLRRIAGGASDPEGLFVINKYLAQRGDERVKDWASWVANSKWKSDAQRAGAENALLETDPRERAGSISALKMQSVLRMIVLKVMYENGIDAFVNPENTLPPFKLGHASEPMVNNRDSKGVAQTFTAVMGAPEIQIPAGFTEVVYEPKFVLSADRKSYEEVTGEIAEKLRHPMPISLTVWGAPGDEPTLIKVASAYEAATHHRKAPPMFPPLTRKP
jgi:amidase